MREEYAKHMGNMKSEWLSREVAYDLQLAAQLVAQAKKQAQ
jgi:hypothetical protein